MINYIVSLFTSYMVNGPLKAENSMTAQSEAISNNYLFATIIPRSQLTTALYLGIAVCRADLLSVPLHAHRL